MSSTVGLHSFRKFLQGYQTTLLAFRRYQQRKRLRTSELEGAQLIYYALGTRHTIKLVTVFSLLRKPLEFFLFVLSIISISVSKLFGCNHYGFGGGGGKIKNHQIPLNG